MWQIEFSTEANNYIVDNGPYLIDLVRFIYTMTLIDELPLETMPEVAMGLYEVGAHRHYIYVSLADGVLFVESIKPVV